jgi:hypothetical protein
VLVGGGVYLTIKSFSTEDTPTHEQAQKNSDADDTPDDDALEEAYREHMEEFALEDDEEDKPRKKTTKPIVVPPPVKPVDPAVAAKRKKVNAAIAKGAKFLKDSLAGKTINGDQYLNRVGATALVGLTLLHCGVKKDDPAVVKVTAAVRAQAAMVNQTYDMACCLWFLDKLKDPKDQKTIKSLALALVANQRVNGGWDYTSARLSAPQQQNLQSLLEKAGLESTLKGKKAPGPPTAFAPTMAVADLGKLPVLQFQPGQKLVFRPATLWEDNSLTQFAILALWAAKKHGVPTDRSLALAAARYRACQNTDGSWPYQWIPRVVQTWHFEDSMACAGLIGLAVGRGVTKAVKSNGTKKPAAGKALAQDPQVVAAFKYLGNTIGKKPLAKTGTPRMGMIINARAWGDLYFFWSLERVGVIYNVAKIGGKDWYDWGSEILVQAQEKDGSWREAYPGLVDTSFALLFLKRVNVVQDLTTKLQGLDAH